MSVRVLFDDNSRDNAVLLLAAAEELGLPPSAVRTSEGGFEVPDEVAEKAGLLDKPKEQQQEPEVPQPEPEGSEPEKEPEPEPKKTPVKRTAKRTAKKKVE